MEKDNLIDKPKEWQWPLKSMPAPHFLTVKRQSLVLQVLLLLFALVPVRVCVHYALMCVYVPGCCCGGTVARTNHYLVVAGLERSAVWKVRLCSTGARCSRAPLKCPIKEGRVRFEWVCVWECVWNEKDGGIRYWVFCFGFPKYLYIGPEYTI